MDEEHDNSSKAIRKGQEQATPDSLTNSLMGSLAVGADAKTESDYNKDVLKIKPPKPAVESLEESRSKRKAEEKKGKKRGEGTDDDDDVEDCFTPPHS